MTVGELLKRADSRELSEWMALFKLRNDEKIHAHLDEMAKKASERAKGNQ